MVGHNSFFSSSFMEHHPQNFTVQFKEDREVHSGKEEEKLIFILVMGIFRGHSI